MKIFKLKRRSRAQTDVEIAEGMLPELREMNSTLDTLYQDTNVSGQGLKTKTYEVLSELAFLGSRLEYLNQIVASGNLGPNLLEPILKEIYGEEGILDRHVFGLNPDSSSYFVKNNRQGLLTIYNHQNSPPACLNFDSYRLSGDADYTTMMGLFSMWSTEVMAIMNKWASNDLGEGRFTLFGDSFSNNTFNITSAEYHPNLEQSGQKAKERLSSLESIAVSTKKEMSKADLVRGLFMGFGFPRYYEEGSDLYDDLNHIPGLLTLDLSSASMDDSTRNTLTNNMGVYKQASSSLHTLLETSMFKDAPFYMKKLHEVGAPVIQEYIKSK